VTKKNEVKTHKLDWLNWVTTLAALFIALLSCVFNYCDGIKNRNIRIETYLDEAWDHMVNVKDEKRAKGVLILSNSKIEEFQLTLAKRKIDKALLLDSENPKAIRMYGVLMQSSDKNEEALYAFERAINYDKNFWQAHNDKGLALFELGRMDKALKAFQEAFAQKPDHAIINLNMALVKIQQDKISDAIALCQKAITGSSKDYMAYSMLAGLFVQQKEYKDAIEAGKAAIFLNKYDSSAHCNLGTAYQKSGNYDDALQSFETAISLNSLNELAYNSIGALFFDQRKYDEAIKYFKWAIYIDPNFLWLYENLLMTYQRIDKEDELNGIEQKISALKGTKQPNSSDMYRIKVK
jgi:superkiller protein 3